jgi:hypothetical protein
MLLTYQGYREYVCGGKSDGDQDPTSIWPVRTVIAMGEAAALTAGTGVY